MCLAVANAADAADTKHTLRPTRVVKRTASLNARWWCHVNVRTPRSSVEPASCTRSRSTSPASIACRAFRANERPLPRGDSGDVPPALPAYPRRLRRVNSSHGTCANTPQSALSMRHTTFAFPVLAILSSCPSSDQSPSVTSAKHPHDSARSPCDLHVIATGATTASRLRDDSPKGPTW
jgi:hypothetical protein